MTSLESWRSLQTATDFNGYQIQVYEDGMQHETAMLLIHGFPTAAWDWHKLWPTLAKRYRLVAPDLIGFGSRTSRRTIRTTSAHKPTCVRPR